MRLRNWVVGYWQLGGPWEKDMPCAAAEWWTMCFSYTPSHMGSKCVRSCIVNILA